MSFDIILDGYSFKWTAYDVNSKLEVISKNKNATWIRPNLIISEPTRSGCLSWTWCGRSCQSFQSIPSSQIDLEKAKDILEQLGKQIPQRNNHKLSNLFNKAVNNFNRIAPEHQAATIPLLQTKALERLDQRMSIQIPRNDKVPFNLNFLPSDALLLLNNFLKSNDLAALRAVALNNRNLICISSLYSCSDLITSALEAANQIEDPDKKLHRLILISWQQFKMGDQEGAKTTLRQAKQQIRKMNNDSPGQKVAALGQIAVGQARINDLIGSKVTVGEAEEIINQMKEGFFYEEMLFAVSLALAKNQAKIDVDGAKVTARQRLHEYLTIKGNYKRAEETANQIQYLRWQIPVLVSILDEEAKALRKGKIDRKNLTETIQLIKTALIEIVKTYETQDTTEVMYEIVERLIKTAEDQAIMDEFASMQETIQVALDTVESDNSFRDSKFRALMTIANFEAKHLLDWKKTIQEAKKMFDMPANQYNILARHLNSKARKWCEIAVFQGKNNDLEGAEQSIREAKMIAYLNVNLLDKIKSLMEIYDFALINHLPNEIDFVALKALVNPRVDQIENLPFQDDGFQNQNAEHHDTLLALTLLAKQQAKMDVEGALATADLFEKIESKDEVLGIIVKWQVIEDVKGALATAASIVNPDLRDKAFVTIIKWQAQTDVEGALATADLIVNLELRAQALEIIIEWQSKTNIEKAKELTYQIRIPLVKSIAYRTIAKQQALNGDFKGAIETAHLIQNTYLQALTFDLISELQTDKDIEGAITTALLINEPICRKTRLSKIAKKQIKENVPGAIATLKLIEYPQIKADAILAILEDIGETQILTR